MAEHIDAKSDGSRAPKIDPQSVDPATLSAMREKIQSGVGQIVIAMMNVPRYRHQSLTDLSHLVLDPLVRDCIIQTKAQNESNNAGPEAIAGFAIWASVSDNVATKIGEQVKAGVFPLRLKPDDWKSGEAIWLIDIIAPNQEMGKAVLASFKNVAGDKPISIHPIVAQAVGKEVIEAMKVQPATGDTVQ